MPAVLFPSVSQPQYDGRVIWPTAHRMLSHLRRIVPLSHPLTDALESHTPSHPPQPLPGMSRTITQSVTSPATYIISTLGPLTTVFTPPPSCTPSTITTNGQRMLAAPSDCMPPNFTPSDDYPTGLAYLNYYSPGICPSGYENAMPIPPALLSPGELGYRCCPRSAPRIPPSDSH